MLETLKEIICEALLISQSDINLNCFFRMISFISFDKHAFHYSLHNKNYFKYQKTN